MRPYLRLSYALALSPAGKRWIVVWLVLNVADLSSTWFILHLGGQELGPLAAHLLAQGASFAVIVLLKLAYTVLLAAWVLLTGPLFPPQLALAALQLLCLVFAGVVLVNLIGIGLTLHVL